MRESRGLGRLVDRRPDEGTELDRPPPRDLALALNVFGCILRVTPVFALGCRASGLVAIEEHHQLVTDGLCRVIRRPSYVGLLLGLIGWSLSLALAGNGETPSPSYTTTRQESRHAKAPEERYARREGRYPGGPPTDQTCAAAAIRRSE
jgi:hypothetical protein